MGQDGGCAEYIILERVLGQLLTVRADQQAEIECHYCHAMIAPRDPFHVHGHNECLCGVKPIHNSYFHDDQANLQRLAAAEAEIERLTVSFNKSQAAWEAAEAEIERLKARRFPIQGGPSIPWSVIAPCEAQAKRNHDQTLERLAERGGLDSGEACAVLLGLSWRELEAQHGPATKANQEKYNDLMLSIVAKREGCAAEARVSELEKIVRRSFDLGFTSAREQESLISEDGPWHYKYRTAEDAWKEARRLLKLEDGQL